MVTPSMMDRSRHVNSMVTLGMGVQVVILETQKLQFKVIGHLLKDIEETILKERILKDMGSIVLNKWLCDFKRKIMKNKSSNFFRRRRMLCKIV